MKYLILISALLMNQSALAWYKVYEIDKPSTTVMNAGALADEIKAATGLNLKAGVGAVSCGFDMGKKKWIVSVDVYETLKTYMAMDRVTMSEYEVKLGSAIVTAGQKANLDSAVAGYEPSK